MTELEEGVGGAEAPPVTPPNRGGAPTRAERERRKLEKAARSFDRETAPAALARIADMVKDPKTPASVIPQLIVTATQLRALLPSPESAELSTDFERRLAGLEKLAAALETAVADMPLVGNGRPGLILLPPREGNENGPE